MKKVLAQELDNTIPEEEGEAKASNSGEEDENDVVSSTVKKATMTFNKIVHQLNRNHAKHEKFSEYRP